MDVWAQSIKIAEKKWEKYRSRDSERKKKREKKRERKKEEVFFD